MNRRLSFMPLFATALLAACGGGPRSAGSKPAPSATWRNDQVARAVDRLNHGEPDQARRILQDVLARDPGDAAARRLLREIDGKAAPAIRKPAPERRAPPPPPRPSAPPPVQPAPPPRPAMEAPRPAPAPAPARGPARAARLRAQGLEEMNRGAIGRAVALLAEASRLDPANPLIRRDLERAQRIQRTVRGAP